MATDLLANLNEAQRAAVIHGDGPLLIVAGAGTGKTTVITSRVAWLMTQGKAPPASVLALTFTDKAAGEMEERIDRLVPYGTLDLWVSTFHGFCQRLLAAHALEIGLPGGFKLLNQTQQWLLVREHFDRFTLKHYRPLGNPTKFIHALLQHFSRAKDEAVSPADYLRFAQELELNTDTDRFLRQLLTEEERASLTAQEIRQLATQEIAKIREVADAYHVYQQLLLERGAMDFGDLITATLRLLRERPRVLAQYRAQFRYLLVDEFQDTNWAQYELVKLLAEPKKNLTVVGDDDQCLPASALINRPGGETPIVRVRTGMRVGSAVGRGHVSFLPVRRVFRRTKRCRLVTFTTARGYQVTVTDNHKMFCLAPQVWGEMRRGIAHAPLGPWRGNRHRRAWRSLVMPAAHVLHGHYLPVVTRRGVRYDRVVRKTLGQKRRQTVYDLEVPPAHNFVADGVVVHNSIYKFRGASVANILQFKHDYPHAKEIFLTTNYRSRQGILDASYQFIQKNNPERLEVMLASGSGKAKRSTLSKKMAAARKGPAEITHQPVAIAEDEVALVVSEIARRKDTDPQLTWSDFAVLARANDQLLPFAHGLQQARIPHQLVSSRGLYTKPVVLDIINFLRLLDNYHESPAMYRVLSWEVFGLPQAELVTLNYWARRKSRSLWQMARQAAEIPELSDEMKATLRRVLTLIDQQTRLTRTKGVREVALSALEASGYLKWLTATDDPRRLEQVNYLNQFFRRIAEFEAAATDRSVSAYLRQHELELEAGEAGTLAPEPEQGPDAVKLMTVHAAKGLEFAHVFVVNLVERRFPTLERAEPIPLPDGLIKERLPGGDVHLQEERRLLYVAVTRAKDSVTLTSASTYGGTRVKRPSVFLAELGVAAVQPVKAPSGVVPQLEPTPGESRALPQGRLEYYRMPEKFSHSQLQTYETCPWKYRFAYLLRVPVRGRAVFSFGQTMHAVLQRAYQLVMQRQGSSQGSLFAAAAPAPLPVGKLLQLDELTRLYRELWIDDWYADPAERQRYYAHGEQLLADYYASVNNQVVTPKYLEQGFTVKLEDVATGRQHAVFGKIDRIDERDGQLALVDYKTGAPKRKLTAEDKEQLLLYQLAAVEVFQQPIASLTFHYLEGNLQQTFLGTEKDLARLKSKILTAIAEIERGHFVATPGRVCASCEYRDICEYRAV